MIRLLWKLLPLIWVLFVSFLYKDLVIPIFRELNESFSLFGRFPSYQSKFFHIKFMFVFIHIVLVPFALLWISRKIRPFRLQGKTVIPPLDNVGCLLLLYLTVFLFLLYWYVFFWSKSLVVFTCGILLSFLICLLKLWLPLFILFLSYCLIPDETLHFLPRGWALFWAIARLVILFLVFVPHTFSNFLFLAYLLFLFIIFSL